MIQIVNGMADDLARQGINKTLYVGCVCFLVL